jgi:hypothetical protein
MQTMLLLREDKESLWFLVIEERAGKPFSYVAELSPDDPWVLANRPYQPLIPPTFLANGL